MRIKNFLFVLIAVATLASCGKTTYRKTPRVISSKFILQEQSKTALTIPQLVVCLFMFRLVLTQHHMIFQKYGQNLKKVTALLQHK